MPCRNNLVNLAQKTKEDWPACCEHQLQQLNPMDCFQEWAQREVKLTRNVHLAHYDKPLKKTTKKPDVRLEATIMTFLGQHIGK